VNSHLLLCQLASIAALGIALVVTLVLVWLIVRSIRPPMRRLKTALQALSQGDLSVSLNHNSRDEMGELSRSVEAVRLLLNTMIESLHERSLTLQRSAHGNQILSERLSHNAGR